MADYSDPVGDARAEKARRDEEMLTGFRGNTCLSCGCLVAIKNIHREKCEWVPKVPTTVYVNKAGH